MIARQTLDRAMTETELQAAIVELAHLRGWLVMHTRPAMSNGKWSTPIQGDAGFPDLVLARDGVVLFLELKTAKGKLTKEQERWRRELGGSGSEEEDWDNVKFSGGCYAVVRPSRWSQGHVEVILR